MIQPKCMEKEEALMAVLNDSIKTIVDVVEI